MPSDRFVAGHLIECCCGPIQFLNLITQILDLRSEIDQRERSCLQRALEFVESGSEILCSGSLLIHPLDQSGKGSVVFCARFSQLTEGAPMLSMWKVVGVMSCGLLLCVGLSGRAALAADQMKTNEGAERIGGQAAPEAKEEKRKIGAGQVPERVGGQAGKEGELEKRKIDAEESAERVGGQAGLEGEQADQKGAAHK